MNGTSRQIGQVIIWEPGVKLVVEWRGVNFAPNEVTTVEVLLSPEADGSRVSIRHYGLSQLPDDHPIRHGQPVGKFLFQQSSWWGGLLSGLQRHINSLVKSSQ